MLKTRIIGVLNILNGNVVQSFNFDKYLPIGKPEISLNYLDQWGIDEIILLDINKKNYKNNFNMAKFLSKSAARCNTPIAAGGGVRTILDIEKLIFNGADKVVINSHGHNNTKLFEEGSNKFGNQAIVASIDVRKVNNEYVCYTHSGNNKKSILKDTIKEAENSGAGEIFINSIDRDGTKTGFDKQLISYAKKYTSVPLTICGGAGKASHFNSVLRFKISGIAAGNFFHFSEHSVISLKSYLIRRNKNIRLDTLANYRSMQINDEGRILPLTDNRIDRLRFKYIEKEII